MKKASALLAVGAGLLAMAFVMTPSPASRRLHQ
jgi:hypothetical protein